jgi:thioredoxin-like negative regulator of GroEL
MRTRHILGAILWAAVALLAGYALMPQPLEIGLMLLRDRDFDGAAATYASQWRAGVRTWTVAYGLAAALRGAGDPAAAAEILAQFLAQQPTHREANRLLADLWLEAGDAARYTSQLETLARLEPSAALWRELAAQYQLAGNEPARARVLDEMVRLGQATEQEASELASWLAVRGRRSEAAEVLLRHLKHRPPGARSAPPAPATMELLTRLLIDLRQPDLMRAELLPWLNARNDLDQVARFAYLLSVRGHLELAGQLVAPYSSRLASHPDLLLTSVEIARASGRSQQALGWLTTLMQRGQLPEAAWEPLIDLALENNQYDLARNALFAAPPDRLPIWLLAYFAERALQSGDQTSLTQLAKRYGDGFLATRPLVGAVWALGQGDGARALQWANRAAAAASAPPRDLITLASVFARLNRPEQALQMLEHCAYDELPEAAQVQLAWLYVDLKQVERGLAHTAGAENSPAWAILAAANGAGDKVVEWVRSAKPGPRLLLDLYYLSASRGTVPLQWALASEIQQRGLAEAARIYPAALLRAASEGLPVRAELEAWAKPRLRDAATPLAEREAIVHGLLAVKSYALALPSLREWAEQRRGTWFYAYLDAAAAVDQPGLIRFLDRQLASAKPGASDAEQLLYALVEHGGPDSALPHIRRFAEQRKGDWIGVYEWVLTLLKKDQELIALWRRQAADPTLSEDRRRELAYRLLQAGETAAAEPLFRSLAAGKPARSKEVEQLRFLWGPRPAAPALDWLEQRAREAPAPEAAIWASYLLEAGEPQRALRAMSAWPNPKPEVYLRALQAAGQFNLLERELEQRLQLERDPETARRLARLALEQSWPQLAEAGFRTVLARNPRDRDALAWQGKLAFAALSYQTARQSLAAAVELGETDPEVFLLLGECVERDEGQPKALDLYRRGLSLLAARATGSYDDQLLEAHLLSRAGSWEQGQARWQALLKRDPSDRRVRADYAALLIHRGLLDEAKRVLSADPRPQAAESAAVTAEVAWPDTVKFDSRHNDRELIVRATTALPERAAGALEAQLQPWVEGVPAGYDSLLVRSKVPVRFELQHGSGKLRLTLRPQPRPRRSETDERLLANRLEILRAQLELARGELARSSQRYRELLARSGADPTLLVGMAMVQGQIGRWRQADRLYQTVLAADPTHAEAIRLQSDLWRQQRDQIKLETRRRSVGKLWEDTIAQLSGHHLLTPSLRAGYMAEWNQSFISGYRATDGGIARFDGRRQRAELFLQRDAEQGARLRGQFFLGNRAGAGADYFRPDDQGAFRLTGEFRRPFWEFMEAVAQHGVRSRLSAERLQRLGPVSAWITASVNRYGLDTLPRAADTIGVSGGANYPLTRSRNPLFADYSFDAERARFVATRAAAAGPFTPLPFASREIHAGGFRHARRLNRDWRIEGAGGMALDRLGGRAPYFAGRVVYDPPGGIGLEAWFDRRLNRFDSVSQPALQFGLSVTWRYGSPNASPNSAKADHP